MNCYPENIEQKLGFDKIRESIKDLCLSELGEELCAKIEFSNNYNYIQNQIGFADEFLQILVKQEDFPENYYYDLRPFVSRLKTEGTYILQDQLFMLRNSLETIIKLREFFLEKPDDTYPMNKKLAGKINLDASIIRRIDLILDEKGEIKSNASPELFEIRQELKRQKKLVSNRIHQSLKVAKKESWAAADAVVSVRDGRLVIPVNSFNKRQMGGIVVDESASGQTSFVEPKEVVELNNKIKNLLNQEKKEIIKILIVISDFLRDYLHDINLAYNFLAHADFNRAKSKYSRSIKAVKPIFKNERLIQWKNAIHPLLYLKLKEEGKPIVPLSIELHEKRNRIALISGPNAGGKSISLKTLALVQYMFQCGLLVPMQEDSEVGLFDKLLIDIGDEQSIDNDLSTYSSHLLNMKNFNKMSTPNSLIFIDEFGTGTEPNLGGAIAEAVLEKFNQKKLMGVITTHYGNLKQFATGTKGIVNAAMLYDTHKLEPTFKLSIGKAGSSFAFEAARKIGLDEKILKLAESKVGKEQIDFDKNLRAISRDKLYLEKKREELRRAERKHKMLVEDYESRLQNIRKEEREILAKAKSDAEQVLKGANKLIENTVSSIKKKQADKAKTKEIRQNFEQVKEKIITKADKKEKQIGNKIKSTTPSRVNKKTFEVGDKVKLSGQNSIGEIIAINKKRAHVVYGSITTQIDISKLEHISENEFKDRFQKTIRNKSVSDLSVSNNMLNIKKDFSHQLDVRGKRAEEAIQLVADYIDNAIVCDAHEVKILHGTGTGALRLSIREYLAGLPHVSSYRDENVKFGGTGITVVKL